VCVCACLCVCVSVSVCVVSADTRMIVVFVLHFTAGSTRLAGMATGRARKVPVPNLSRDDLLKVRGLLQAYLTSFHLTSPHFTSPHLTSLHSLTTTSLHFTSHTRLTSLAHNHLTRSLTHLRHFTHTHTRASRSHHLTHSKSAHVRLSMVLQESQFDELDRRVAALERTWHTHGGLSVGVGASARASSVKGLSGCPRLGRQASNEPYVTTFSGCVRAFMRA
jgi:hypothetical protein